MALGRLWQLTTPLDRLLILLLAALAVALWLWLLPRMEGERVVVERDGKVLYTAPLDEAREALLPGPLGDTRLAIREGKVCVLEASCPHKVCMGMGEIGRAGELLACVPNRLVIRIVGDERQEGTLDARSR